MGFQEPYKIYTADSNMESHLIVNMLRANGIDALAVEDQSGVSLWAFGRISQFHQPDIWIEKSDAEQAALLIRDFESAKQEQSLAANSTGDIRVECEECGKSSVFPQALDGPTQECSHCHAYVDVGELGWDDDFGEPEE